MKCPYCTRQIYAMTGLQEIHKFQKHLGTCRKYPGRKKFAEAAGTPFKGRMFVGIDEALKIRAESGQ